MNDLLDDMIRLALVLGHLPGAFPDLFDLLGGHALPIEGERLRKQRVHAEIKPNLLVRLGLGVQRLQHAALAVMMNL